MWSLWLKAKTYGKLPSEVFAEGDSLAAWMLDSAVTWFGLTIENALNERDKVGVGANVEYKPRYTLSRLLHQGFKLPRPPEIADSSNDNPWSPFMAWIGKGNSGVRRWVYTAPEEPEESEDE